MKNPKLSPMPQISDILSKTCQMLDISKSDALSNTRKREVVECRQMAMYFCAENTKYSLSQIGYDIADKDHCTVLHAKKAVQNLLLTSKQFRDRYVTIEAELKKIIQVGNLCDIDLTKWGFEFELVCGCAKEYKIALPDIATHRSDGGKKRTLCVEGNLEFNTVNVWLQVNDMYLIIIRQVETLTELQEVYRGFTGNYLVYQE